MAARSRGRRARLADGQHFLRSPRLAAENVAAAGVGPADLILEIGAGTGRLTQALRRAGCRTQAVEVDAAMAAGLRRRFAADARTSVVEADILSLRLPEEPYRAFGNIPFGITTPILRRLLDDPGSPLQGADLIVQDGLARKRTSVRPCSMLALSWLPWWRLELERRLPAACFAPPPAVDAAVLAIRRRDPALLPATSAGAYRALLRTAFSGGNRPLRRTARIAPPMWKRLARDRGLPLDARPQHLDVWDWVALFEAQARR